MRTLTALLLAAMTQVMAAQPADDRYVVRLDPAAAIDRVDVLAAQLAATHGATIVSTGSATDDTIVLRMPQTRIASLAADPRVRSVEAMPSLKVAAEAKVVEPVDWTTGVNFSYDGSGAVTKIGADEFAYDDVGRLVRAKVNNATRTYQYDAFGNRKQCRHETNTDCQYAIAINSANNRIVESSTTEYDDAGNLTDFGTHDYTYDAANVMTSDHTAGARYEYLYTADDLRLARYHVDSKTWEWTLRDHGGAVVREFSSSDEGTSFGTGNWSWTRDYVHRDGRLLASRFPHGNTIETHHYHLDHLGSARRVTDSTDLIVGYHDYYAFGPEIAGSLQEQNATDHKYTGHEREPGISDQHLLDYMQGRFYNPTLGRFLSPDPALDIARATMLPQVWNRYAYALNSPMTRIDPDGRSDTYFDPADNGNMIRLRVNVWYDTNTVNREYYSGGTVRSRMEESLVRAQAFYARAGILLDFRRLDVDAITDEGTSNLRIWSGDKYMLYDDFAKTTPGLDIFVTQNEGRTGVTRRGGPTLIGNQVGPRTVLDELAHALGNTRALLPFPNFWTDIYAWMNERAANKGKPMNEHFVMMLRGGAREVCAGGACD